MKGIFLTASLLFFAAFPLFSEEGIAAFLTSGPVKEVGLPFIYPNALDTYTGYYRLGEKKITIFFTTGDFIIPDTWEQKRCGNIKGRVFTSADGFLPPAEGKKEVDQVFFFRNNPVRDKGQWSVFIVSQEETECAFTEEFIKDLEYFQRDNEPFLPPLLPAVVEIPGN